MPGLRGRVAAGILLALVTGLAHGAESADAAELRAACDAPRFATTRVPAVAGAALPARVVALSQALFQWPAMPSQGHFVLVSSATGALVAKVGEPVVGADDTQPLAISTDPVPPALAQRFKYVAAGAVLRAGEPARVTRALRGQALIVREDDHGRVLDVSALQAAGALDDAYAPAEALADLGVTPTPEGARFALWAPTAQAVSVCLHATAQGRATAVAALARDDATGAWRGRVPGARPGGYFTYLVDVFVPGTGLVRNRVTDPYSISLGADSRRSYIGALGDATLMPRDWPRDAAPASVRRSVDMAIYELHLRDFSIGDASVPAAHRGKYLAFTDAGSAGMRHLRALAQAGLTDVHLLPVFDLASVPERGCTTPTISGGPSDETQQAAMAAGAATDCFNWGYDPFHYNAPEGSYASNADDGAVRVREFRAMVQGLHRAGLRVGMDVVYNHTSTSGQAAQSVLDRVVPGYYQRLDANGAIEHSTCCDNTATENRMMGKLLVDSVTQWAVQYHVDSFRFDLMGHQPRAVMEALQRRLKAATGREIPLVGEGWNFGEVADGARFVQASQLSLAGTGIGTFSDRARDAVRGGSATDSSHLRADQGWINGEFYDPNGIGQATRENLLDAADLIRIGLAGSVRDMTLATWRGPTLAFDKIAYGSQPAGYASQPGEAVNYVENHDNQTLFDNNVLKLPLATSGADRARVQILGAAVVAFSQGVAYFHAGVDLLRSKSFDKNSFDSGDWFNRLDWTATDNGFGAGLPPKQDNGDLWAMERPLLADASLKPTPADIAWTRDAFRDLLRIRASTSLFHLASAADVRDRITFPASGPAQEPTVIAEVIDGKGLAGAKFAAVLVVLNADKQPHVLDLPALGGHHWQLHPVHLAPHAADARIAKEARVDDAAGRFTLPARSAIVFVAR
jgi:pullulanase/glycogen debranching enzyme